MRFKKLFLHIVWVMVAVHFLKDITQDILHVATPLDLLGDVKEDLTFLPSHVSNYLIYGIGGISVLLELFLIVAIPYSLKNSEHKLKKYVYAAISFLVAYFVMATVFDPYYREKLLGWF